MDWLDRIGTLVPALIAIFVAYIAYAQWRLSRANYAEKLFDRRYRIVKLAKELAFNSQLADTDKERLSEQEFFSVLGEAKYLFTEEIEVELLDLVSNVRRLRLRRMIVDKRGNRMTDLEWKSIANEENQLEADIAAAASKIDRLTAPFLFLSDAAGVKRNRSLGHFLGTRPHSK